MGAGPRVGLLVPMRSELAPVVRAGRLAREEQSGAVVHRGTVGGTEVVATLTGIGTARARAATARLLDAEEVDHVVVSGIAGGIPPHVEVGDLVVPSVVVDADGNEHRATALGAALLEGRLRTSDDFHVDAEAIDRLARAGVVAVDMETAAIAAECDARGVPWTAFRGISDMAGDTPAAVLTLTGPDGSPRIGAALRYLATHPRQLGYFRRLARDAGHAAAAAADAAIAAIAAHWG
jgi:adenosylhomocysteine nucleosidase